MGLMDILEQYASAATAPAPEQAHAHFDTVAASAGPDELAGGITHALQSGDASFADSVARLFGNSNPDQRVGILQRLIAAAGPGVLSSIAGGALAQFAPVATGGPVAPADAANVSPAQAGELASAARQHDPGVVERVGAFYAQHPTVVKALGAAALTLAMNHMARRGQQ